MEILFFSSGEWDPDKDGSNSRGPRTGGGFHDSANNSDDGERFDSDNESSSQRKGREYKDKDSDSLDSSEKKEKLKLPSTPARGKPAGGNLKKIDLGAAAHFGKDTTSAVS